MYFVYGWGTWWVHGWDKYLMIWHIHEVYSWWCWYILMSHSLCVFDAWLVHGWCTCWWCRLRYRLVHGWCTCLWYRLIKGWGTSQCMFDVLIYGTGWLQVVLYRLVHGWCTCLWYKLIIGWLVQVYNSISHSDSVTVVLSFYIYFRAVGWGKDRWL